MADRNISPPAVPFSGDRAPRAHVDRLDEAEEILGHSKGQVYEVKASQWGHDEHHWKRGELLREKDLADHYSLKRAIDNGTVQPASGEVNARMSSRRGKAAAGEGDEEEDPFEAAERTDPDDEGAKPPAEGEPYPPRSTREFPGAPKRQRPFAAAERTDPDDEGAKPALDPDDARVRAEQGLMPTGGHDPAQGITVGLPSTGHVETTEPKPGTTSTGHSKK